MTLFFSFLSQYVKATLALAEFKDSQVHSFESLIINGNIHKIDSRNLELLVDDSSKLLSEIKQNIMSKGMSVGNVTNNIFSGSFNNSNLAVNKSTINTKNIEDISNKINDALADKECPEEIKYKLSLLDSAVKKNPPTSPTVVDIINDLEEFMVRKAIKYAPLISILQLISPE